MERQPVRRPIANLRIVTATAVLGFILGATLSACAPAGRSEFAPAKAPAINTTGGRTADNKVITDAGNDAAMAKLKFDNPIERLSKSDLELATQIVNAKVEFGGVLRSHVVFR